MLAAMDFVPVSEVVDAFLTLIEDGYPVGAEPISLHSPKNIVEGWHCAFQCSLLLTHSSLLKLFEELKPVIELYGLTAVHLLSGHAYKPKRVYRILNERLNNVVADNSNCIFMEFLRGIANNLHLINR
ncbi:hypothetical protein RF11_12064 [Thelohanellus kitauei]|uniref:Uncharacterized protein n=1 Tax=Thelohanellus kitauei TaxID=669202 RepID=A0A0C2ITM5_THEKT|nr:hypothetical protein RF11_12064 [Thelohanellus kitauei]